jgi:type II secretory pathway component PulF
MDSVLRQSSTGTDMPKRHEILMPNLDTDIRSTVTSSTVHLLFLLALAYFMLLEVPRFEKLFVDMNLVLSGGFTVVLDITTWLKKNRLLFSAVACFGLLLDAGLFLLLRRYVSKACSLIYGWIISILLVGTIGMVLLVIAEMLARILKY